MSHKQDTLELTPQEALDLDQPYSPQDAFAAFKLGMATGMSELGLTPEEFERMGKFATAIWNPIDLFGKGLEGYATLATLLTGVGALGGAYSGYSRSNIENMLNGKGDPETMALRRKIRAYQGMSADLKRNSAVMASSAPGQVPA